MKFDIEQRNQHGARSAGTPRKPVSGSFSRSLRTVAKLPLESLRMGASLPDFSPGARWGALVLGLWISFAFTGKKSTVSVSEEYPLPKEIPVRSASVPTHLTTNFVRVPGNFGDFVAKPLVQNVIRPAEIDFSKSFNFETERYMFIKKEDFWPTRMIGHLISCFGKIFFLDSRLGAGLDADGTKAVLSMVERDKNIKGLTVRINHNAVWKDTFRNFYDPKIGARNGWFPRWIYGAPGTFLGELTSECRRGDYYNPMTSTMVCYSNVRSISAHELGHHKDYHRFSRDWPYALTYMFPPATLYQEWNASRNARADLSKNDQWQFQRFLIPAFCTYLLAMYEACRRGLRQIKAFDQDKDPEKVEVSFLEGLRFFGSANALFWAGLWAGSAAAGVGVIASAAAFVGVGVAAFVASELLLSKFIK